MSTPNAQCPSLTPMEAKFSKKAKMGKENEPQGSIKKGFVLCPEPLCFKHIGKRGLKTHLLTHREERAFGCDQCAYRAKTRDYV